jgi:putative membrane protein
MTGPGWAGSLAVWTADPAVIGALAATAVGYAGGVRRARRRHGRGAVPTRQVVAFTGGLVAIALALVSPLDYWAEQLFSAHMVQHDLLAMVAPPLLLLGAPVTVALRAVSPAAARRWIVPTMHSRPVLLLTAPPVAFGLFTTFLWVAHLSPLYDAALRDDRVHALEHVGFLVLGLLFWWPVVGIDPNPRRLSHPARLLYLFVMMPASSLLGLALTTANHVLYPAYILTAAPLGVSPLADQRLAGAIMWEGDMLFVVTVMAMVLLDWLDSDERRTVRAEGHSGDGSGAAPAAQGLGSS